MKEFAYPKAIHFTPASLKPSSLQEHKELWASMTSYGVLLWLLLSDVYCICIYLFNVVNKNEEISSTKIFWGLGVYKETKGVTLLRY